MHLIKFILDEKQARFFVADIEKLIILELERRTPSNRQNNTSRTARPPLEKRERCSSQRHSDT